MIHPSDDRSLEPWGPEVPPTRGYPGYLAPTDVNDAREALTMFRRHAVLIAAMGALGLAAAAFIVSREAPLYRATATVRLTDTRGALAGGIGDAAVERAAVTATDPLLSQIQVLRSRAIAEAVVAGEGLRLRSLTPGLDRDRLAVTDVAADAAPDTFQIRIGPDGVRVVEGEGAGGPVPFGAPVERGGVRFTVASAPPGVAEARLAVVPLEVAVGRMLERLEARPRSQTDVVDLEFTDQDPLLAQRVVNATALQFQLENMRQARQRSLRRREFVEEQLAKTDAQLAAAQLELSRFRSREQVFSAGDRMAAQQGEIMQLDVRQGELEADRRAYQVLLGNLRREGGGVGDEIQTMISAPGVASNPAVASLFTQLVQYQTALDSLTTGVWRRSETNPDVERLRELLASTRGRLADALQSHVEFLNYRLDALVELRRQMVESMRELPERQAEEVYLGQQLLTLQKISDQLREELQRARIAEAVEVGQVEMVDMAALPTEPLGRSGPGKLMFGLAVGLLMGGVGAHVRERLNTAINRHEDIEPLLQIPNLAVIPRTPTIERRGTRPFRFRRAVPGQQELVTVAQRHSPGAEAYRILRTNLIFSRDVDAVRSLMVTSSSEGEGKTTTAANLAVSLAQQGRRVLLVDADMRRPRVHRLFHVRAHPGLSDLLADPSRTQSCVSATSVQGLHVLAAGTLPENPSELLGHRRMGQVIESMKEAFDTLIFDSPPLMAASDGAVLASQVDGVLLVIRAGQTERAVSRRAVEQMEGVGAEVLGAVLNDPDGTVPRYTYSGTYDHRYYTRA